MEIDKWSYGYEIRGGEEVLRFLNLLVFEYEYDRQRTVDLTWSILDKDSCTLNIRALEFHTTLLCLRVNIVETLRVFKASIIH